MRRLLPRRQANDLRFLNVMIDFMYVNLAPAEASCIRKLDAAASQNCYPFSFYLVRYGLLNVSGSIEVSYSGAQRFAT